MPRVSGLGGIGNPRVESLCQVHGSAFLYFIHGFFASAAFLVPCLCVCADVPLGLCTLPIQPLPLISTIRPSILSMCTVHVELERAPVSHSRAISPAKGLYLLD